MTMKTVFALVLASFLTFSLAFAQTDGPPKRKIRIGVPNVESPNMLPFRIAETKGFFAAEGIAAEIIRIRSDIVVAALISSNLDYGTPITYAIPAAAKGAPLRAIAGIANGFISFLVAQPRYRTVGELRGKTLAVGSLRGVTFNHLKRILERNGLDAQKDVKVLAMGSTPARFQALLSGNIDATFLTMPYNIRAVQQGMLELDSTADARPQTLSWGLAATEEKLRASRDEVRALLRSVLKAMHFVKNNKSETVRAMTAFNLKSDEAERGYEIMSQVYAFDGRLDIEAIAEVIKEAQVNPTPALIKQVNDFSVLEEAMKELALK